MYTIHIRRIQPGNDMKIHKNKRNKQSNTLSIELKSFGIEIGIVLNFYCKLICFPCGKKENKSKRIKLIAEKNTRRYKRKQAQDTICSKSFHNELHTLRPGDKFKMMIKIAEQLRYGEEKITRERERERINSFYLFHRPKLKIRFACVFNLFYHVSCP